jgi:hypothetical protein
MILRVAIRDTSSVTAGGGEWKKREGTERYELTNYIKTAQSVSNATLYSLFPAWAIFLLATQLFIACSRLGPSWALAA